MGKTKMTFEQAIVEERSGGMMYQLKSVDILSVAKIMGVIYGLIGLILVPIFLVAAIAGVMGGANRAAGVGAAVGMLVLSVIMPVIYGAIGFVGALIGGALYNFLAGKIGGIKIN